jgi:hypothetical protein
MVAGKVLSARMDMCRKCLGLRGPFFDAHNRCERVQRCGCEPRDPLWNAYDYNSAAELCHCCAWRVVPSGSKWSLFFCEPCKAPIRAYNQAAGLRVVPLGRHSIMNDVTLSVATAESRRARRACEGALPGLFERIATLWRYHHAHLARVANAIDAEGATMPLSQYIERAHRDRPSTAEACAAVVRAITAETSATGGLA